MLTALEAQELLRRITFKIRIEKNLAGAWEWGTGFFISQDGYALTAFHNLPESVKDAGRGTVDVYYRDAWHALECLVSNSLPESQGDIAVLQLLDPPSDLIEFLPAAYLDPSLPRHQRMQLWAGRPVYVFGFPFQQRGKGQESRFVDGLIDAGQPLVEVDEKSSAGWGPTIVTKTERLRFLGLRAEELEGISGAPILDRQTGKIVGVEGSYDPNLQVVYGTEIAQLLVKWPDLANYAEPMALEATVNDVDFQKAFIVKYRDSFLRAAFDLFRKGIGGLLKRATKPSIKKERIEIESTELEKADLAKLISSEVPPLAESPIVHLLPKRHHELTGRDAQVSEAMAALQDLTGGWMVAIDGMGGIGKTTLAWEIAHKCLSERLFNAVIWETAKGEELVGEGIQRKPLSSLTFETVLDTIAQHLGSVDILKLKEDEKRDRVKSLLKGKRVLVVLDNLDTAKEDQDEIARKLLPLLNPSKALFTSRHKLKFDVSPIHLTGLKEDDAVSFIQKEGQNKRIQRVSEAAISQLKEISNTTGGAPLAMKLIVGQLAYLGMDEVLENLRHVKFGGLDYEFYKFIYWPSWKLLSEGAKRILVSMSHFTTVGGDKKAILAMSQIPEDRFAVNIQELWTTSLVEIGGSLEETRYSLHPLTQYFVLADIVKEWEG